MSPKIKHHWSLDRDRTTALLHSLAEALQTGRNTLDGFDLSVEDMTSCKIRIDPTPDDRFDVGVTVKGHRASIATDAADAPPSAGSMSFSAAKRVMQTSFKAVRGSLTRGKLPTPESMDDYLASSLAMCAGQSDPAYAEFATRCERLRTAYDAADLTEVNAILQDMIAAKRDCHKRLA